MAHACTINCGGLILYLSFTRQPVLLTVVNYARKILENHADCTVSCIVNIERDNDVAYRKGHSLLTGPWHRR